MEQKPIYFLLVLLLVVINLPHYSTSLEEEDDVVILNSMMQRCREAYHTFTTVQFWWDTRDRNLEEIQDFIKEFPDHVGIVRNWMPDQLDEYIEAIGIIESCVSFEKEYKDYWKHKEEVVNAQSPTSPAPSPFF
ncbi:hypothetical protein OROHE_003056 [Orobanche hederae]